MIKTLTTVGIERTYVNKSYLWQIHSQYNIQWWKTESLLTKLQNKPMISTLSTTIQIQSPSHSNQTRLKISIQIEREEINYIQMAWYFI